MIISPVLLTLIGFVLAAASALTATAVAWGAFRTQLERQRDEIKDLRGEVHELRALVQALSNHLSLVADRQSREPGALTPVHGIPIGNPPRQR